MGQIDIPLNEIGIKQAHISAKKIAPLNISRIVSSPLRRATQTSEIIAQKMNAPIAIIEELKNANAGIMEGQDRGDGKWLEQWRMGGNIEGAEPWSKFVSRVAIGLNKALAYSNDEKPILIVGHGPTFWALIHILNAQTEIEKAENCVIYFFDPLDLDANQWKVRALGK